MKERSNHLRLVKDGGDNQIISARAPKPRDTTKKFEQLGFDFTTESSPERLIVLIAMDTIHGKTLSELIQDIRPRVVVDLRYAVRFDLPGANRDKIFQHFRAAKAFYTLSSVPWHELKPADFMSDRSSLSQRLHHELLERKDTPLMFLVPKPDHALYLTSYLNRKMSEAAEQPWQIKQVV